VRVSITPHLGTTTHNLKESYKEVVTRHGTEQAMVLHSQQLYPGGVQQHYVVAGGSVPAGWSGGGGGGHSSPTGLRGVAQDEAFGSYEEAAVSCSFRGVEGHVAAQLRLLYEGGFLRGSRREAVGRWGSCGEAEVEEGAGGRYERWRSRRNTGRYLYPVLQDAQGDQEGPHGEDGGCRGRHRGVVLRSARGRQEPAGEGIVSGSLPEDAEQVVGRLPGRGVRHLG